MTGAEMIAAERRRQIESEGWTAQHDDTEHAGGGLLEAAVCYAGAAEATYYNPQCVTFKGGWRVGEGVPSDWPWAPEWWKPSDDPIRNLVKAGALIAAEIDRLQRLSGGEG